MFHHENKDLLSFRDFERRLCDIAAQWRASWGNEPKQNQLVEEYCKTMSSMFALGVDEEVHIECELPDEFMPEEYLQKYPKISRHP